MVDGAMDALDRVAAVRRCASATASWSRTRPFPPLLDLLEQIGCDVVGVDTDDGGLDVEGFGGALGRRPGRCSSSPGRRTRPVRR